MALLDRINREILEINRQIARIQERGREEVRELNRRKDALTAAMQVITPELEKAVAALEAVGISLNK